jgi:hypothetical protein
MRCDLISKIGSDANATFLLSSLSSLMGVGVDDVIRGEGINEATAFTYVIVCQSSLSRTCIHTPLASEITPEEVSVIIENTATRGDFQYLHFDSRHTEAAALFSEYVISHQANRILSIDVEKSRPHLGKLLRCCHIIFTNKQGIKEMFPSFLGTT